MGTLQIFIATLLFATAFADIDQIFQSPDAAEDIPGLDECGFQIVKRIIGGTETKAGEFPWLAALEYRSKATWESEGIKCGGSIITKRYILTAAHCINPPKHSLMKIWLGVWKISTANTTDKDVVVKFDIAEKIVHESYTDATAGYDIALIKVSTDIVYTNYIRPICLPKVDAALPPLATLLTVTGWGFTETGFKSDIKLKVDVPVLDNSVCVSKLGKPMLDSQMCAGAEKQKDSCQADSGGPLMQMARNPATGINHWFPHGFVSYGRKPCGDEGFPAVYTRVSKFMNWILKNTKHENVLN